MFKKVFFILLFVLPFTIKAQSFIGLEAGFVASHIHWKPKLVDYQLHAGFNGGIQYHFNTKNKLKFYSGLRVQRFGYDYNAIFSIQSGGIIKEGRIQYRFMSLSIPARIGYQFGEKFKITPNIGIGANYILSANTVLPKSLTGLGSLAKSTTFLDKTNQFTINALISTEFSVNHKTNEFYVCLEYQHGLTNAFKPDSTQPESDQKNLLFGLNIGCRIPMFQKTDETGPVEIQEDL